MSQKSAFENVYFCAKKILKNKFGGYIIIKINNKESLVFFLKFFDFIGTFFSADILLSLGTAIAVGLIFNRIVKKLGLPNVTGYLVAGVLIDKRQLPDRDV